jgi:carboxymethylenebutenolidase
VKKFLDIMPPGAWGDDAARQAALELLPAEERNDVTESMTAVFANAGDIPKHVATAEALIADLREVHGGSIHIGSVGFCMGGGVSFALACGQSVDVAAVFYGRSPADDVLNSLTVPVLGCYGADDHGIVDDLPRVQQMTASDLFEPHIYPKIPHAFFNDTRGSYRVEAARDSWARTLSFFARHLAADPAVLADRVKV